MAGAVEGGGEAEAGVVAPAVAGEAEAAVGAHHPHRVRARNIGHKIMIAIDLEVDGELTLREAHDIAHRVEDSIKSKIENVFDVAIHIEPLGDMKEEKALGINKENL